VTYFVVRREAHAAFNAAASLGVRCTAPRSWPLGEIVGCLEQTAARMVMRGERGTQPAGCWPKNDITAAAANPEILPLEFLLGDDPVHGSLSGWIAEW
jgi:hypothetical protein